MHVANQHALEEMRRNPASLSPIVVQHAAGDALREIERLRSALSVCVSVLDEITFDDGSTADRAREDGRALLNEWDRQK